MKILWGTPPDEPDDNEPDDGIDWGDFNDHWSIYTPVYEYTTGEGFSHGEDKYDDDENTLII